MDPVPNFPDALSEEQQEELVKMENCLYHKNVLEHCKDSALEIIDARGALHAFYHWPKSLANHLAARLLLRWKWIYLVKYRFWYLILPEEDDPNKKSACFYNITKDEIESYDWETWQECMKKLIETHMLAHNEAQIGIFIENEDDTAEGKEESESTIQNDTESETTIQNEGTTESETTIQNDNTEAEIEAMIQRVTVTDDVDITDEQ